jgi:hypothetical protein
VLDRLLGQGFYAAPTAKELLEVAYRLPTELPLDESLEPMFRVVVGVEQLADAQRIAEDVPQR